MNYETSIFWLLALFAALSAAPRADAAATVKPVLSGFSRNGSGGYYGSVENTFNAAMRAYSSNAIVPVGGRTITVPAKIPLAANAGDLIKGALKRTPWGIIAGTLAAAWLGEQGIEWLNDQWHITDSPFPWSGYQNCISAYRAGACGMVASDIETRFPWGVGWEQDTSVSIPKWGWKHANGGYITTMQAQSPYLPNQRPMTDDDWNSLPDPTDAVAPELPSGPGYMPEGAPVGLPEYQGGTQPLGSPYTAPDGSTRQDHVTITNNYNTNTVTITTSTTTITDSNGNPVPNPEPVETEPQQSECEKHPTTIGCSEYGMPDAMPNIPVHDLPINATPTPVGGAGSCPADITTSIFGLTWSYQPFCNFATAIKPLIIGFAWLSFAYIVGGAVRT